MKKSGLFIFGIFLLVVIVTLVKISAASGVCCERLDSDGQWCQNVLDESQCDSDYRSLATSCDQSSFCTLGTCVDENEGNCLEGVPQQVCNEEYNGYWTALNRDEVPQCQLGCCLFGDQALYVTATACTYQSAFSGIEPEFDTSISSETECIAQVLAEVDGACVYETPVGTTTCRRMTSSECDSLSGENVEENTVEFFAGKLCSAPELGTICGATERTICEDYDVYFIDSCNNKANIYDASQLENQSYWSNIVERPPCDDGLGNKNSKSCGNCDYFSGSLCQDYKTADSPKPDHGTNICSSLDCGSYDTNGDGKIQSDEQNYKHGESWCATYPVLSEIDVVDEAYLDSNVDVEKENVPGSRYVSLECRNGEVVPTECDTYRNTICAEDFYDINENGERDSNEYRIGQCVANKWQDCVVQTDKESCEDGTQRDCRWVVGTSFIDETGENIATDEATGAPASCVPKFSPGFNFWEEDNGGNIACSRASTACTVVYEVSWIRNRDRALGDKEIEERIDKCVQNCYCIPGYDESNKNRRGKNKYENNKPSWHPKSYEEWISSLNLVCSSLGDCGNKVNYIGEPGEERDDVIDTGNFIKNAN